MAIIGRAITEWGTAKKSPNIVITILDLLGPKVILYFWGTNDIFVDCAYINFISWILEDVAKFKRIICIRKGCGKCLYCLK